MPEILITLPTGYTMQAVLDHSSTSQVWEIRNGEGLAGILVGFEALQVTPWFSPDEMLPPASVVYYECKIAKLNIRLEPRWSSDDIGDISKGQKVGIIEVVEENSRVLWGKLETGGYACIEQNRNVYLEKLTTDG